MQRSWTLLDILWLHVYMQDAGCDDPTMPVLLAFHSWHVQSTVSAQLYVVL